MQTLIVSTIDDGVEKAKKVIYDKVDRKTVFFLSGGSSPKSLYQSLALDKKLHPAAVAFVDERYGTLMHDTSNEKMIRRTGLSTYFSGEHIPVYPILQENIARGETADKYDQTVRKLLFNIPKSVAIMSIGVDGHTAGIAPNREDFINPLFHNVSVFVGSFNDTGGSFKERITLTFQALSLIDYFILWVFGEEKRHALGKIFTPGNLEEIPGRFFNQPEISEKVTLITDLRT
ncbi:MAG TPA: 6-phosphogluconolactonase [Candidatus Saccharimonadales bacterium]|nr:6-phosphogluconolactonase [Candidatus Saccharimonadales bacterium]